MNLLFDQWSVWHALGGLVMGFVIYNYSPRKIHFEWAIGLPIIFELVEQNIVASWFKIIEPELLMNSMTDLLITIPAIFLGICLAKRR